MSLFCPDYYTCSMVWVLGRCRRSISFFYQFQGRNLLVDDQDFKKGGDIKKRENQISSEAHSKCILNHYSVFVLEYSFPNDQCYYLFLIFK